MIRVLVAEDSLTVRRLLVELLSSDPAIQVVGEARNGAEAVEMARRLEPDVITMDIVMPVQDGLSATRQIMSTSPTPILIVSATTRGSDVEQSMDALRAGALMVVPKPGDPAAPGFAEEREQLIAMVKAMADVKVVRLWGARTAPRRPAPPAPPRPPSRRPLVAIGASTGGPAALQRILGELPADFPAPILVVQHIARGFVDGLAAWLDRQSPLRVKVAEAREAPQPGTVYLARDDLHLGLGPDERIILSPAPPIGGFRPSADFLFESVGRVRGESALALVLTGMGRDGVDGLAALHAAGGRALAQDEASSVVYGMAQEAVRAGVVDDVIPLDEIARRILEILA